MVGVWPPKDMMSVCVDGENSSRCVEGVWVSLCRRYEVYMWFWRVEKAQYCLSPGGSLSKYQKGRVRDPLNCGAS